jgi:creatinine amidohydrolase
MEHLFDDRAAAEKAMRGGALVCLPVNPIEYHGPHLSLRNDHLVSVGLMRDLHATLQAEHPCELLVAHDLDIGVEPAPGPGSVAVSFPEVTERVGEACRWLADHGARRVVLMTFHGSPLHNLALEAGVRLLRRRGIKVFSAFNLVLRELLGLEGARYAEGYAGIVDPVERAEMIRTMPQDFHGGFFETSMALHYAKGSVLPMHVRVPPCPPFAPQRLPLAASKVVRRLGFDTFANELALAADGLAWHALRPFPGYTGRPHRATAEAGAAFGKAMVSRYREVGRDVLFGTARSPRPIMRWMPLATLGGRLGPRVALGDVARFA